MLVLIFINIAIIINIYLKYYKLPKNTNNTKQKIEEMDPMIIGCINDKGFNNNFDFILSEIVNLNIKGYLEIEYDKEEINKYDYKIKQNIGIESNNIEKYELIVLNFLFSEKMEISKSELEEKLINTFNSYNVQYNDLKKVLQDEIIKQNIIDKHKNEKLNKFSKKYIRISIILIISLFILKIFKFPQMSLIYIQIYIFEKIVSSILLLNVNIYTDKGENLRSDILLYKEKIEKQEFLIEPKTMNQIILEKAFADSIALHINTEAKEIFINNKMIKNATKSTKKIILKIFIILVIVILIGIILQIVTKSIKPDGIFWLYTILVLLIALSADITKMLATSKKKTK